MFADGTEAGRRLAAALPRVESGPAVVLALPWGGVPVAAPVARALGAPLDLALVRKVGVPGRPEIAVGAVTDGGEMRVVVNEEVASVLGLDEEDVREARPPRAARAGAAARAVPRRPRARAPGRPHGVPR